MTAGRSSLGHCSKYLGQSTAFPACSENVCRSDAGEQPHRCPWRRICGRDRPDRMGASIGAECCGCSKRFPSDAVLVGSSPGTGHRLRKAQHLTETRRLCAAQEPFLTNRIRLVLHTGQVPLRAGRPFFSTTSLASVSSRFVLHLTQYASIVLVLLSLSEPGSYTVYHCTGSIILSQCPVDGWASPLARLAASPVPEQQRPNYAKPQGRCPA